MSLSIVVPVFNAERTLDPLVERVRATAPELTAEWELILVNDGSADSSWRRISELASREPRIRGLDLDANYGQHNALLAGIRAARHEVVVTLDDDLQNPPEEIGTLLAGLSSERDVVYGVPFERAQPLHRRLATASARTTLRLTAPPEAAQFTAFRAMRAHLRDRFQGPQGRRVSIDALLRRSTDRFGTVPVRQEPRRFGSSNYTLAKLARHAAAELLGEPWRRRAPEESYAIRRMTGAAGEAATVTGRAGPCEPLEWDSEHFGFRIARATEPNLTPETAEELDRWCAGHGVRCLYLLAEAADAETARLAAARGFRAVDTRLTLSHDLDGVAAPGLGSDPELEVREATAADLPELCALASRAHETTRFYFDGNFPRDRCDSLYRRWVERAQDDDDRVVLVPEVAGEPAGYQAIGPYGAGDEATLELFAIAEAHRRRGLGAGLLRAALRWVADHGATGVVTAIQARNTGALKPHLRVGFRVDRAQTWFHRWYPEG